MSQLRELRRLLFEPEQETLEQLQERVDDPLKRATDIAQVLPQALELSSNDRVRLVRAMRRPVDECIRESVRGDPASFADALFPVMGPAIRKAIAEAMRSFMTSINRTVEQSVSWQGIKWRLESVRTGVPVADLVVRDTLLYNTEQVFLIQRESGQLMAHLSANQGQQTQDNEAVSAMLTAIQDFVRDSFGAATESDLDTVQIGGRTVWLVYGPEAMLAGVFSGTPPSTLRVEFHACLEELHERYATEFESYAGDRETMVMLEPQLAPLLSSADKQASTDEAGSRRTWVVVLCFIVAIALFYLLYAARERAKMQSFLGALDDIPGIVVLDSKSESGVHTVRALRDPLAQVPQDMLGNFGLDPNEFDLQFEPFNSAEPEVLLQKFRQVLAPPISVKLAWRDGWLVASGSAPNDWLQRAKELPLLQWSGVKGIDLSELSSSEQAVLAQLRVHYRIPNEVTLALKDNTAVASGFAPAAWLLSLDEIDRTLSDLPNLDAAGVRVDLASLADYLKQGSDTADAFAYEFGDRELRIYGTAVAATYARISSIVRKLRLEDQVDIGGLSVKETTEAALARYLALVAARANTVIYFSTETKLRRDSEQVFEDLARDIENLTAESKQYEHTLHIDITGFADGTGDAETNRRLRGARASWTKSALVRRGIAGEQITTRSSESDGTLDRSWRRALIQLRTAVVE